MPNKREKILIKKSTNWRTRKHIFNDYLNFLKRLLFASPKNTHNFIRVHFKRNTFYLRIYFLTFFLWFPIVLIVPLVFYLAAKTKTKKKKNEGRRENADAKPTQ